VWLVVTPLCKLVLSPKFHWKLRLVPVELEPSTLIVRVGGVAFEIVKFAVGPGVPCTIMTIEPEPDAPVISVAVAMTRFSPAAEYACWTLVVFPGNETD
jgi:hypothetical protein